jgi:hypothetical protein
MPGSSMPSTYPAGACSVQSDGGRCGRLEKSPGSGHTGCSLGLPFGARAAASWRVPYAVRSSNPSDSPSTSESRAKKLNGFCSVTMSTSGGGDGRHALSTQPATAKPRGSEAKPRRVAHPTRAHGSRVTGTRAAGGTFAPRCRGCPAPCPPAQLSLHANMQRRAAASPQLRARARQRSARRARCPRCSATRSAQRGTARTRLLVQRDDHEVLHARVLHTLHPGRQHAILAVGRDERGV